MVMPALVAGIPMNLAMRRKNNRDGRNKSGHDGCVRAAAQTVFLP
jgi:hypothetical protein